jgi:hypothetical protein
MIRASRATAIAGAIALVLGLVISVVASATYQPWPHDRPSSHLEVAMLPIYLYALPGMLLLLAAGGMNRGSVLASLAAPLLVLIMLCQTGAQVIEAAPTNSKAEDVGGFFDLLFFALLLLSALTSFITSVIAAMDGMDDLKVAARRRLRDRHLRDGHAFEPLPAPSPNDKPLHVLPLTSRIPPRPPTLRRRG